MAALLQPVARHANELDESLAWLWLDSYITSVTRLEGDAYNVARISPPLEVLFQMRSRVARSGPSYQPVGSLRSVGIASSPPEP
mmetsp:Transcript_18777/g.41983  ORF Transcript_18777/g.41983 Transcript_18777/m.41983 type:complete len:84 (-) Transcript_18777:36-287(-)